MDDNPTSEFENIVASVYTITNDPFFSSLGFKPQPLSKVLKRKSEDKDSALVRGIHNIPMDAALHCVIITLIVFIVLNLVCKLLLYILMQRVELETFKDSGGIKLENEFTCHHFTWPDLRLFRVEDTNAMRSL